MVGCEVLTGVAVRVHSCCLLWYEEDKEARVTTKHRREEIDFEFVLTLKPGTRYPNPKEKLKKFFFFEIF